MTSNDMTIRANTPITIWQVGGDDVRLRIPLLLALRERGFGVGAIGSESGEAFATHPIPYFQYTLARGINPFVDRQSCRQLLTLFRQHRPDVVHGFDTKPAILAPLMAVKAGIPGRVRTITGMGYVFSSNSPIALTLRPIYRSLQRNASVATGCTIFQNPDDRDYFYNHGMAEPNHAALILSSGIEIDRFLSHCPSPETLSTLRQELGLEGKRVVTMIARLVVSKGVKEYLDAAAIVCQQMPDVKFLLVGPRSSEGRQAVSAHSIDQRRDVVDYLGTRNDIPALLALSDVFVLPSYYREGVPRVLLEAGAMGLPLITTHTPGCKEVVRDGWNGLLVPPRNATALAAAILKLLQSPEERLVMGKRSRSHIEAHFSLNLVADAYANIYYQVLGRKPPDRLLA